MPACFRILVSTVGVCAILLSAVSPAQQPAPSSTGNPALMAPTPGAGSGMTSPTDAAQKMIAAAIQKMNTNDPDGALNDLSQAIKVNPNSTGAYVLRASIYCQKKQWTQAEDDFKAAARIAPTNSVLKFNLVEVKFMQKQYDVARPGFVALENDPDMGDFASYKVFLCDLFGGHEAAAKRELDVFNAAMGNPSYYFSNAAWSLVHKNLDDARSWLLSASRIYPPQKNIYYAQSLRDLGYLPIPAPGDHVTPAPSGGSASTNP
jgi:tetratricopeptide (TPR) repeat protein